MSDYKVDPNNSHKQIPNTSLSYNANMNRTSLPVKGVVQERPTSVILNEAGTYGFLYETTCSAGTTPVYTSGNGSAETYVSGGAVTANTAGPVELPIQPVAWVRGTNAGDAGDVIFVYKGVK